MKREFSLKGKILFQEVYRKGQRFYNRGFQLIILDKDFIDHRELRKRSLQNGTVKIGISIGKKIGKAYIRNRVKRQIRSICREFIPEINPHFCIIIRPGKNILALSYQEQIKELRDICIKAGIMGQ